MTIITGYLGAGKTTLLNHLLRAKHGRKIAVIVNEFGQIGIDGQLVVRSDEEIVEMNNGCICCRVRGDLVRIVGNLLQCADPFDHLVIETTGLADPAPVIQSFFVAEEMRARTTLDAVVTVVDAKHIAHHWDSTEAQEQIAFADVVILNKQDLVKPEALQTLLSRVRSMNAFAEVFCTDHCRVEVGDVLGLNAFDLKNALAIDPGFLTEGSHEHDQSVYSVALANPGVVNGRKLMHWLNALVQEKGADIFRIKGILNVDDEDRRFVFQGVHMLLDGRPGRPWKKGEIRKNEIVFIGRGLQEEPLRQQFRACLN
ncbi:MAG TPA: GTP-binding protein [Chthoniobacterales bacterium]